MNTRNQNNRRNLLESAKTEFLKAWASAQEGGPTPNLPDLARRHPEVASELIEWAINFSVRQAIIARDTEPETTDELTDNVVDRAKLALRAKPENLNEALKAFGWSQFKLGEKLNVPPQITAEMCNGLITNWPRSLEESVAAAFLLPLSAIATLQANSYPAAANFSAIGDPNQSQHTRITFREAIENALEDGEISPENARFWIEELEAEGK